MSETEKYKRKKSPSTSARTAAVSSSSANAAGRRSSSNSITKGSSTSSSGFANFGVRSSTGAGSSSNLTRYIWPPPPMPQLPSHVFKRMSLSGSVSRPRTHYPTALAIRIAFVNFMKDPECLDRAANYLYESLLEDAVMGIYLEVHHSFKSGALQAIEGLPEDDTAFKIVDIPNYDVFGISKARKPMDCNCPNCDRLVAAIRFAPHLEKCMGMGRKTSRTASRRLATAKEGNASYFASLVSDDDDDADWSSEKRRKKIHSSRTNGSKRNGKSSY